MGLLPNRGLFCARLEERTFHVWRCNLQFSLMCQRVNRHFLFADYIPTMRQTSVTAQTTSERLATVLSYGALLLLGYLVYRIFLPFLVPLAWSAVLAIFFFPLYERLNARMSSGRAALVSTLAV